MQQDLHPSLSQHNIAATALVIVKLASVRKTCNLSIIFRTILGKDEKRGNAANVFQVYKTKVPGDCFTNTEKKPKQSLIKS